MPTTPPIRLGDLRRLIQTAVQDSVSNPGSLKKALQDILLGARGRAVMPEAANIFIHLASEKDLEQEIANLIAEAERDSAAAQQKPLWGIPIAVKDNIDVKGMTTTAGCPDYCYSPREDAAVVRKLREAGAVVIGKTNLDQFATGLVGVRTPYGIPDNPFDSAIVPGGSSSGSACAVARGIVPIALGTDTAGSGRVPAALQGLWGFKSSVSAWSIEGVVPACKTLDCVTVFATSGEDAELVHSIVRQRPGRKPFRQGRGSRNSAHFRVGIPQADKLWFDENPEAKELFSKLRAAWTDMPGVEVVDVDPAPFLEAAKMLYEGPWVAERWAQYGDFIESHPASLVAVTKQVIESGRNKSASDGWKTIYRLGEIKESIANSYADIDAFVFPTIPRPYTRTEVDQEPIGVNSRLGTYTNFMNLLDYCALAFPFGSYASGFPNGATIFSQAGNDEFILRLGQKFVRSQRSAQRSLIAVCGAHMSGLPLNRQLVELGGVLYRKTESAPNYRMVLLGNGGRPGLIPVPADEGRSFPLELWDLPGESLGALLSKIPPSLALGTIGLKDGSQVRGYVCYDHAAAEADISQFGGWRAYVASQK